MAASASASSTERGMDGSCNTSAQGGHRRLLASRGRLRSRSGSRLPATSPVGPWQRRLAGYIGTGTSMIEWTLKKIIGTKNERELKRAWPKVARINALESRMRELRDEAFPAETARLKQEVANGRSLDDVLFEAFALTREAARRAIGQRHFDVQLIGGMFLHQGCIAEMRTGEGKTLTATLPSYLNALSGRGVHVVT